MKGYIYINELLHAHILDKEAEALYEGQWHKVVGLDRDHSVYLEAAPNEYFWAPMDDITQLRKPIYEH